MTASLHCAVLPRQPEQLARGSCVGHQQPDLWTSEGSEAREAARNICAGCRARGPCLDWAVAALPASDLAIYAGTSAADRARIRRARRGAA